MPEHHWNIDFHDSNPAAQAEGQFALSAFKVLAGVQMDFFRKAWFGEDSNSNGPSDMFDGMVNFAMGDDIYKR